MQSSNKLAAEHKGEEVSQNQIQKYNTKKVTQKEEFEKIDEETPLKVKYDENDQCNICNKYNINGFHG